MTELYDDCNWKRKSRYDGAKVNWALLDEIGQSEQPKIRPTNRHFLYFEDGSRIEFGIAKGQKENQKTNK